MRDRLMTNDDDDDDDDDISTTRDAVRRTVNTLSGAVASKLKAETRTTPK